GEGDMAAGVGRGVRGAVPAGGDGAGRGSPAVPTSRPVAASMAGRQTSVWAALRCLNVRVSEPSIIRVKPARSAWTMAARRRCIMRYSTTSAALKGRRSALAERTQPLAQVLRALALTDASPDPWNVRLGLGELLDGALHVGHRQRRQAGKLGGDFVHPGLEFGALDQPVEIAHAQEIIVGEIFGQQEGTLGEARTDL